MKGIKKIAPTCMLALALPFAALAEMPRSEWHNLVSPSAQNPETLKNTIGQLSASDQTAFLAEINEAIGKMPGSDETRAAAFYAANRAAVSGATRENRAAVLAEVFATVPPEFLTDINERFATELFSRAQGMSDEKFVEIAKSAMATIIERCQKAENADVRGTFAILMFLRASGGSPADLTDTLVALLPDASVREQAKNEWIKPAMGDGQEQTYNPMLGFAQAGEEPDHAIVMRLSGSQQVMDALLGDLQAATSGMTPPASRLAGASFVVPGIVGIAPNPDQADIGLNRVPRAFVQSRDGVGGTRSGTNAGNGNPYYTHDRGDEPGSEPGPEPGPYGNQGIGF
ncbi:MAG: hypothetical protein ACI4Q3_01780 [Kiritimatiellia bacterium]